MGGHSEAKLFFSKQLFKSYCNTDSINVFALQSSCTTHSLAHSGQKCLVNVQPAKKSIQPVEKSLRKSYDISKIKIVLKPSVVSKKKKIKIKVDEGGSIIRIKANKPKFAKSKIQLKKIKSCARVESNGNNSVETARRSKLKTDMVLRRSRLLLNSAKCNCLQLSSATKLAEKSKNKKSHIVSSKCAHTKHKAITHVKSISRHQLSNGSKTVVNSSSFETKNKPTQTSSISSTSIQTRHKSVPTQTTLDPSNSVGTRHKAVGTVTNVPSSSMQTRQKVTSTPLNIASPSAMESRQKPKSTPSNSVSARTIETRQTPTSTNIVPPSTMQTRQKTTVSQRNIVPSSSGQTHQKLTSTSANIISPSTIQTRHKATSTPTNIISHATMQTRHKPTPTQRSNVSSSSVQTRQKSTSTPTNIISPSTMQTRHKATQARPVDEIMESKRTAMLLRNKKILHREITAHGNIKSGLVKKPGKTIAKQIISRYCKVQLNAVKIKGTSLKLRSVKDLRRFVPNVILHPLKSDLRHAGVPKCTSTQTTNKTVSARSNQDQRLAHQEVPLFQHRTRASGAQRHVSVWNTPINSNSTQKKQEYKQEVNQCSRYETRASSVDSPILNGKQQNKPEIERRSRCETRATSTGSPITNGKKENKQDINKYSRYETRAVPADSPSTNGKKENKQEIEGLSRYETRATSIDSPSINGKKVNKQEIDRHSRYETRTTHVDSPMTNGKKHNKTGTLEGSRLKTATFLDSFKTFARQENKLGHRECSRNKTTPGDQQGNTKGPVNVEKERKTSHKIDQQSKVKNKTKSSKSKGLYKSDVVVKSALAKIKTRDAQVKNSKSVKTACLAKKKPDNVTTNGAVLETLCVPSMAVESMSVETPFKNQPVSPRLSNDKKLRKLKRLGLADEALSLARFSDDNKLRKVNQHLGFADKKSSNASLDEKFSSASPRLSNEKKFKKLKRLGLADQDTVNVSSPRLTDDKKLKKLKRLGLLEDTADNQQNHLGIQNKINSLSIEPNKSSQHDQNQKKVEPGKKSVKRSSSKTVKAKQAKKDWMNSDFTDLPTLVNGKVQQKMDKNHNNKEKTPRSEGLQTPDYLQSPLLFPDVQYSNAEVLSTMETTVSDIEVLPIKDEPIDMDFITPDSRLPLSSEEKWTNALKNFSQKTSSTHADLNSVATQKTTGATQTPLAVSNSMSSSNSTSKTLDNTPLRRSSREKKLSGWFKKICKL